MASQRAKMNKKEKAKSSSCKYRGKKCLFKKLSTAAKGNILHCNGEDCNSTFHLDCYLSMVNKEKDGEFLKTSDDKKDNNKILVFCGKQCYNREKTKQEEMENEELKRSTNWYQDGFDGGPSSYDILLQWLTDQENANLYFGAKDTSKSSSFQTEDGETKRGLCNKIARLIEEQTKSKRSTSAVRAKIADIFQLYKETSDWISQTGQGVKENEGEERFLEVVQKRCKFYWQLEPVMQDRHSIKPPFNSDMPDDVSFDDSKKSDDNDTDDGDDSDHISQGSSTDPSRRKLRLITETVKEVKEDAISVTSVANRATITSLSSISKRSPKEATKAFKQKKKARTTIKSNNKNPLGTLIDLSRDRDDQSEYLKSKAAYYDARAQQSISESSNTTARLEYEKEEMKFKASMKKAEHNITMMRHRAEAQKLNPNLSPEEINNLFPLME